MGKENNSNYVIKIIDGKKVYKRATKLTAFDVFNYTFMILFAFLCIFPCLYVLLLSFADRGDYLRSSLIVIPYHFNFENYKVSLYQDRVFRSFCTSVFVTATYVAYAMSLTSLGAYAFTKKDVPGLKFFFAIILFTMFFGGGLVPFYLVIEDTIGTENLASIIIPFGINTFNMIILRNFFSQVPDSIIDSCRLDGASDFRILFTFVIPLSKAGMATIILYYLVGKWDDWYWPAILLANTPRLAPLALKIRQGLNNARTEIGGGWDPSKTCPEASNAAMMIIGLIPIMLIYPFLQKYFAKGVMLGGVKG